MAHFKSEDLNNIPADRSCTDLECRWKGHASKKTAAAALDAIQVVK